MENIHTLISESDSLISKESWKYSEVEMDRLLTVCNHLFDIYVKLSEDNDISKMKHENKRGGEFVELKEQLKDGKKQYTDTSAGCYLDGKYEQTELAFLTTKYLLKTIENKLKLLERKENIVKKHFKS